MTDVELDLLARQNECILTELHSMRDEMGGMRDEIRALSALMLKLDSSAKAVTQEMHAISGLLASHKCERALQPAIR
jgi:hypothetical protein